VKEYSTLLRVIEKKKNKEGLFSRYSGDKQRVNRTGERGKDTFDMNLRTD